MVPSRLRRFEEKNATRRIAIAIFGSIAILVFLALFGVRILIGFSLLIDRLRGGTQQQTPQQTLILPPILDPLPEATKSATLTVHGRGAPKTEVALYLNDEEYKKIDVDEDGTFEISGIPVEEGKVTLNAKLIDEKNNTSDFSNTISTLIDRTAPKLAVDKPEDNTTINDGTHKVTVNGVTDEDMKVTINDRIVVVKADGSFTYSMPLNDGENKLAIIARDPAGNETKIERKVIYQP